MHLKFENGKLKTKDMQDVCIQNLASVTVVKIKIYIRYYWYWVLNSHKHEMQSKFASTSFLFVCKEQFVYLDQLYPILFYL